MYPPVIALHYVSDDVALNGLKPWVVSCAAFDRLLNFLERNNFRTVGFEDIKNGDLGRRDVILTFDDCPVHLWDYAIPQLQKRGMKAVFYLPTAHMGKNNSWNADNGLPSVALMDDKDVLALHNAGMEVGSHAHEHIMLEAVDMAVAKEALVKSKTILETILKQEVVSIAYPYGSVPVGHKQLCKAAGYSFGVSVYTPSQDAYAIRRWPYFETDDEKSIAWKLSVRYSMYRALSDKWNVLYKNTARVLYKTYSRLKGKTLSVVTFINVSAGVWESLILQVELI